MQPHELRTRIEAGPLLLDGGLGTMLIREGLDHGKAPEWWLVEEPDRLRSIHRRYAEAGSDILLTNTFGGSESKLASMGLGGRCRELSHRAVELARQAAGQRILVAGDMGPTGLSLPPIGSASLDEIRDQYHAQASALAAAGADLLVLETVYDRREALTAIEAARETGLALLVFMTFESRPRGFFTLMGDPLVPTLLALAEAGADGVGMNCSVSSTVMLRMVQEAASAGVERLMAQPNAGDPLPSAAGVTYAADPGTFAADARSMLRSGLRVVGGCCGTTPEFIGSLRSVLDQPEAR